MPTKFTDPKPEAEFDGTDYRYTWRYVWDPSLPSAAWLMMNPSWAGLNESDRTVDRVMHFSREHDCGGVIVVNLWPLITPDSGVMWRAIRDLPPTKITANKAAIARVGAEAAVRIVAFGLDAGRDHRAHVMDMVTAFGHPLLCLGTSDDGWPYHPLVRGKLYIPDHRQLSPWCLPPQPNTPGSTDTDKLS